MSSPPIEEQLLEIANQVAYEHCLSTKWSSWHFWDYYQRLNNKHITAADPTVEFQSNTIWSATAPYGSCVDIAIQITKSLRSKIAAQPELRSHAASVETLARASSSDPERMTHCLTALFLEGCCIVVDVSFTFSAIKIAMNQHVDSLPAVTLDGTKQMCRLSYSASQDAVSHSSGVLLWQRLNAVGATRQFAPLSDSEAIEQISIPMATDTVTVDGAQFPRRKGLKLQAAFEIENKPTCLPSALVCGKYMATVCRVRADFARTVVTVQVPFRDWLLREENRDLYQGLWERPWFQPVSDAVANVIFDPALQRHGFTAEENYRAVEKVVQRLGMSAGDFWNVVKSVLEVRPLLLDGYNWAHKRREVESAGGVLSIGFSLSG